MVINVCDASTQQQCCRSGMFIPDPTSSIPDPGWQDPGSGSASKNLSIFNPKSWYHSKFSKIRSGIFIPDPGGCWIWIFSIPDPEVTLPSRKDPKEDYSVKIKIVKKSFLSLLQSSKPSSWIHLSFFLSIQREERLCFQACPDIPQTESKGRPGDGGIIPLENHLRVVLHIISLLSDRGGVRNKQGAHSLLNQWAVTFSYDHKQ